MIGRFRKRPMEVEAYLYRGRLGATFPEWLTAEIDTGEIYFFRQEMVIRMRGGAVVAIPGDWIVSDVKGEICPVKPDVFAMSYEAA